MRNGKDIPQSLIEEVRAAATGRPGLPDEMSDGVIVSMLTAAWNHIYAEGYTDGFQDQEGMEIQADLLKAGDWAPRIFIWMDGATEEQAEQVLDLVGDYVHDNEPDGVTLTIGATLAPGKSSFPTRGVSTN